MSAVIICASMLPAGLYFLWLTNQDKNFSHHFLVVNQLNPHRPIFWLFSLLPIAMAGYMLWRKKARTRDYPIATNSSGCTTNVWPAITLS